MPLTKAEQARGIERIQAWPVPERASVARLRGRELEVVVEVAALLDAEPVTGDELVELDKRRPLP